MDAEQQRDVRLRIGAALASPRLTSWQRTFLTDMDAKFERYGRRTRLTEKQHQKLGQILGHLLPEPPITITTRPQVRHQPSRPRRQNPVARQARWRANRLVRKFAFAAAFFAVMGIFALVEPLIDRNPSGQAAQPSHVATTISDQPQISVIDGDTIRVSGHSQSVRLVGFNTPETGRAQCSQEQALGHQATSRLKQLVATGTPSVEIVPCACMPGTHGTEDCNFGRACGVLRVDGRDVGETLVSEGLAVRFRCRATGCPPLPRPWCG